MLNNISNFFSLIKGKRVKKTLAPNDMIAIGVRNPVDRADYQPAGIFFKDLQDQIGGGSISLTTSGISGPASLTGTILNIPNYFVYTHEIGEYVPSQGGVIFHRYLDGGNENYLVVGINDVNVSPLIWDNRTGPGEPPLLGCNSSWDGFNNYVTLAAATNSQFQATYNLLLWGNGTGLPGWYLPAIDELSLLWQNRFNVNRTLSGNSSFGSIPGATQIGYDRYWSSTEYDDSNAWTFFFLLGLANANGKDATNYVRAVRKFSLPI